MLGVGKMNCIEHRQVRNPYESEQRKHGSQPLQKTQKTKKGDTAKRYLLIRFNVSEHF